MKNKFWLRIRCIDHGKEINGSNYLINGVIQNMSPYCILLCQFKLGLSLYHQCILQFPCPNMASSVHIPLFLPKYDMVYSEWHGIMQHIINKHALAIWSPLSVTSGVTNDLFFVLKLIPILIIITNIPMNVLRVQYYKFGFHDTLLYE